MLVCFHSFLLWLNWKFLAFFPISFSSVHYLLEYLQNTQTCLKIIIFQNKAKADPEYIAFTFLDGYCSDITQLVSTIYSSYCPYLDYCERCLLCHCHLFLILWIFFSFFFLFQATEQITKGEFWLLMFNLNQCIYSLHWIYLFPWVIFYWDACVILVI